MGRCDREDLGESRRPARRVGENPGPDVPEFPLQIDTDEQGDRLVDRNRATAPSSAREAGEQHITIGVAGRQDPAGVLARVRGCFRLRGVETA